MTRIRSYNLLDDSTGSDRPFQRRLDFDLLRHRLSSESMDLACDSIIEQIDQLTAKARLHETEIDIDLISAYEQDISAILSPMFSPLLQDNEIKACMLPFSPYLFNCTNRLINLIDQASSPDDVQFVTGKEGSSYIASSLFILQRIYGVDFKMAPAYHVRIKSSSTDLYRYYRVLINADYMQTELADERYRLSDADVKHLLDNIEDEALWKQLIPPGSYVMRGFALMTLVDITRDKAISLLKTDLLQQELLYDPILQEQVLKDLASIVEIPDFRIGFLARDMDEDGMHTVGVGLWDSILMKGKSKVSKTEVFRQEYLNKESQEPQPLFRDELIERMRPEMLESLSKRGIKSYAAIPLIHEGNMIGVLELASSTENAITRLQVKDFADILPLFTMAFRGYINDYETQVKAIIQEKYTAIHPSVEWRFRQLAKQHWMNRNGGQKQVDQQVIFEELFPLYGQTDIRDSSLLRNTAIRKDTHLQLTIAAEVLREAVVTHPLPVYKMLLQQIDDHISNIDDDDGATNESALLNFLRSRIYPAFDHLSKLDPSIKELVDGYVAKLDEPTGLVVHHRAEYEQQLAAVNKIIINALDQGQEKAQQMFPHYFKKYKTDGVEHDMYIGSSLSPKRSFDTVYLDNLRLWQLMITCEIERLIHQHQIDTGSHMQVCSLILVHSRSLAIRFRMDEKQFDVEGAYNLRYEIIKKRIDKATLKGTSERVTQPGKITIIYTQPDERDAYLGYINYLISVGYLQEGIEENELSEMQGVTGLKALRVDIVMDVSQMQKAYCSDDVLVLEH